MHNLLLGSTAAYLATHSPAAVLVMRSNESTIQQASEALPVEVKRS
jgi:hypothetical protein